ncbi:MAG: DoxX family protein [Wolinella sp.]
MQIIEEMLGKIHSHDVASLLLRVFLGILMLLHGIHKIKHGITGVEKMIVGAGFPEFIAYGVYLGEVIAPVMLILGIYTRLSALVIAITSFVIIYVAHGANLLALGAYGGLKIEFPLLLLVSALALVFIGGGRWEIKR